MQPWSFGFGSDRNDRPQKHVISNSKMLSMPADFCACQFQQGCGSQGFALFAFTNFVTNTPNVEAVEVVSQQASGT
jgi:hypothetical protein